MNAAAQSLTPGSIMAEWFAIVLTPFAYLAAGAVALYLAWSFRSEIRALLRGLGIAKISFLGVEISVASILAAQAARAPEVGMGEEEFERLASLVAPYVAGLRILWVDDCPHGNNRERKSFRAIGIQVVNCLDTSEALEALRRDDYHLIISAFAERMIPKPGS